MRAFVFNIQLCFLSVHSCFAFIPLCNLPSLQLTFKRGSDSPGPGSTNHLPCFISRLVSINTVNPNAEIT